MQFLKETEERIDGLKGSKTDDFEIKEILGTSHSARCATSVLIARSSHVVASHAAVDSHCSRSLAGTGSFGKVRLVRHKATSHVYAMKQLSKSVILRTKQVRSAP